MYMFNKFCQIYFLIILSLVLIADGKTFMMETKYSPFYYCTHYIMFIQSFTVILMLIKCNFLVASEMILVMSVQPYNSSAQNQALKANQN